MRGNLTGFQNPSGLVRKSKRYIRGNLTGFQNPSGLVRKSKRYMRGNLTGFQNPSGLVRRSKVETKTKAPQVMDAPVVIKGNRIEAVEAVSDSPSAPSETVIDVQGKTVMPGLCDAHVHVTAWTANLSQLMRSSPSYTTARAAEILEGMLMRGFTTVRDAGGVDYGLAWAVDECFFKGPRMNSSTKSAKRASSQQERVPICLSSMAIR